MQNVTTQLNQPYSLVVLLSCARFSRLQLISLTPPPVAMERHIYHNCMYIWAHICWISIADPGFVGYVVLYCSGLGCIVLYCKHRNTAVVSVPFGRDLGVNGGWRNQFLGCVYNLHFSFYPDICAKHLGRHAKSVKISMSTLLVRRD